MNRFICLLLLFSITAFPSAFAQAVKTISSGNGFKVLTISKAEFNALASTSSGTNVAQKTTLPVPNEETEIILIETLQGLLDAPIPDWLKQEHLRDEGYISWSEVPTEKMSNPIPKTIINVTAFRELSGQASQKPNPPDYVSGSITDFIDPICDDNWNNKTLSKQKTLNQYKTNIKSFSDNDVSANIDTEININGIINFNLKYRVKERCDIPTEIKFNTVTVSLSGDMDASLGLEGNINFSYKEKLLRGAINIWSQNYSWWIYIVELNLELDLNVDYGVNLLATATASISDSRSFGGPIDYEWVCNEDNCSTTKNNNDFEFSSDETSYSSSAKLEIKPFVDLNFKADLDMYGNLINIAHGKIGIVGAIPATYFYYYGNNCSDANGDGRNETVSASIIDVTAEIYAYLDFSVGNKKFSYDIDLPKIPGFDKKQITGNLYHSDEIKKHTLLSKNILFKDFTGYNKIFEPVISSLNMNNKAGVLNLGRRSCNPFSEKYTYDVNWGDGTPNYVGENTNLSHSWPTAGNYKMEVRTITDAAGRNFKNTSTIYNVQATAPQTSATANIMITTGGNINHKGVFKATCLSSGKYCIVYGNRTTHSGPRSCEVQCEIGETVKFDCTANWEDERWVDDVSIPEGATTITKNGDQKVYEWSATKNASASCLYTD